MLEEAKKATVLVIDDSPVIHKIVRRVLERGYNVFSCTSGSEANEKLDDINPDLILLDVEMPELDGFETIKLLRQHEKIENVPIIFLTAKNDVDFEFQAFELGAVDYINKPFANPLLIKRVEIHLSHAMQKKRLSTYNEDLQDMVQEKTKIIKELQNAIVFTLADLVEMRDNSTGGHVMRTQTYFKLILDYLNENNFYQDELKDADHRLLLEASQLHDVGKVAIPDAILLKPGKLTPDEFEIMKSHTVIGYRAIVKAMELTTERQFLEFAAQVALTHHEKWDGSGYPSKLSETDIPIAGRIMAIVDVYDALVSERHYKPKFSHEKSLSILLEGRGTHFDPVLVDAVVALSAEFEEISRDA